MRLAGALLCACILVVAAAKKKPVARPKPPAPSAASIRKVEAYLQASGGEPFEQAATLVPFFDQLLHQERVHIIHWGDSHTAADDLTGGLRDAFQARFGNGGSGFSLAGRPFLGYRRFDARGGGTTLWQSVGGRTGNGDGWFGLGGMGIVAYQPGQSVYLTTECDRLEVQFLQQPEGGRLALSDSGDELDTIDTRGELAAGFVRYETQPGPHRFMLRTLDRKPVRLFGWVADRAKGVTYEALGLNGAEAGVILKWNPEMLATYLQRRGPALIVLAYGTNEASDPNWHHESYREMFAKLVARLRETAPTASILVLGPADRWRMARGRWELVGGIDDIIADQRAVCRELGCAFWDWRSRIGGPGAMRDWLSAGLAQTDRVHFNSAGYRKLASVLFADLMKQFDIYEHATKDR